MRVLFCHDGPLQKDEFNNYYGIAHNDSTFKRYYNVADELAILIRVNKILKSDIEMKLSKITVSPLEVIEYPNISNIKGQIFNKLTARKIVKREVEKSDYIIARLPSMVGYMAVDYAKKYNKRCMIELVTCPWDSYWNHSLKGKLMAPFMYNATKRRVRSASHVIYVTNQFLQSRYPTKGISVNCSNVVLQEFDDKVLENRLQKIEKMNDSKLIIGTTAAVDVKFKGQQYIIEALGSLKKRGIVNFEYQLVGSGNQDFLKAVAKKFDVIDQVKFVGTLKHDDVFKWLDSIDIYVQPSRQEGLPRALIEAMSRGIPAFGAKTAGIPELLDEKFIFSNTKNNIKEICEILNKLDKYIMINQSIRNYKESKKYVNEIINERRNEFFRTFKK